MCRLESEAALAEETSENALNASEEAHELAKRATDTTAQVSDEIWLLEQRYDHTFIHTSHMYCSQCSVFNGNKRTCRLRVPT